MVWFRGCLCQCVVVGVVGGRSGQFRLKWIEAKWINQPHPSQQPKWDACILPTNAAMWHNGLYVNMSLSSSCDDVVSVVCLFSFSFIFFFFSSALFGSVRVGCALAKSIFSHSHRLRTNYNKPSTTHRDRNQKQKKRIINSRRGGFKHISVSTCNCWLSSQHWRSTFNFLEPNMIFKRIIWSSTYYQTLHLLYSVKF